MGGRSDRLISTLSLALTAAACVAVVAPAAAPDGAAQRENVSCGGPT
jgi:hypothetical protein